MKDNPEKSALARRVSRAATLAALLALLAACGQTGPLYLPEDGPPTAAPPPGQNVPPSSSGRRSFSLCMRHFVHVHFSFIF